jgi:hypothetical protein
LLTGRRGNGFVIEVNLGVLNMASIRAIERKIWDREGFEVCILHLDGRDVRSDLQGLPSYNKYERAARHEMTVAEWRERRFKPIYPGYDVQVLDGDGRSAHGATKLGNVRNSYDDNGR